MRALLRDRLVQFVLLGGAIMAVAAASGPSEKIHFDPPVLDALAGVEAEKHGRADADAVAARAIEDELLYREGLRLGLDKDDPIVRQRIIQKTLFLIEEMAGAGEAPTQEQLRACFEAHRERWRQPETVRLVQVFGKDRERLLARREAMKEQLEHGGDLSLLGEPSPVPVELDLSMDEIAATLGRDFAAALAGELADDATLPRLIQAPLRSAYGWHLVAIAEHHPAGPARFEEIAHGLAPVCQQERRERAIAEQVASLLQRYPVTVGEKRIESLPATHRIAIRSEASAED